MKNDNAAREDLSKGRQSSAISVAIARKDNDSRSALGEQDLWEPSNIGIGHGVTNAGVSYTYFIPFSGVARLYSFENQWTTYQNGVDMRFDWGASQFLTKQFQVGLVCYVYKEIGCDSGSAKPLINRQGQRFKSFGKDRFQARLHIALDSSNVSGSLRTCVRLAQIGIELPLPRIGAKNASDRPALAGLYSDVFAAATCCLSVARIETWAFHPSQAISDDWHHP
jgi:hypothetical protein